MIARRDPGQVEGLSRFFKTGPGQYGEGDVFLGIKVPVTRQVVKECWRDTDFPELERCIASGYHEVRLAALLVLVEIYAHAKKDAVLQQRCVDFYLSHTEGINNWDLVDLSCYPLLGNHLLKRDRGILYELAERGKTVWCHFSPPDPCPGRSAGGWSPRLSSCSARRCARAMPGRLPAHNGLRAATGPAASCTR